MSLINLKIKVCDGIKKEIREEKDHEVRGIIVANLLAKGTIRYSRNTSLTVPKKYNNLMISNYRIVQCIAKMEKEGLLTTKTTEYKLNAEYDEIEGSTIAATELFYSKFDKYRNKAKSKQSYKQDNQTVLLKDSNGKLLDYKDNDYTRGLRSELSEINNYTQNFNIQVQGEDLDIFMRSHHKINFNSYGRCYAMGNSHQNMKKEDRLNITINNNPVAEIDFSSLHIRMLLDMYKLGDCISLDDDIYLLCVPAEMRNNAKNRNAVKRMVNIVLNAKTRHTAIYAFNKAVSEGKEDKADFRDGEHIMQCIEENLAFLFKHPAIMQNLFSGVDPMAATLQYRESKICRLIMRRAKELNMLVLSVHDSFICCINDINDVCKVMGDAYREVMTTDRLVAMSVSVKDDSWKVKY